MVFQKNFVEVAAAAASFTEGQIIDLAESTPQEVVLSEFAQAT